MSISYSAYYAKGIVVVPEKEGKPQIEGEFTRWGKFNAPENYKPDAEELLSYDLLDNHGIGLLTGEISGITALDIDHATEDQIKRVIQLLGDSPCKKYGTKGLTIFYKFNGEKNENWKKNNVLHVELLSTRSKTTLPPSLHRNGKAKYKWIGEELLKCYDKLPILPRDYSEKLNSLFSIIKEPIIERPQIHYDTKPSFNEACKALSYCDPNCDNSTWVNIGLSFKSEVGDAGFQDFDAWSSKGKSYQKSTIRSRWRSFDARSIGYGTLVYYAKQGGYQVPQAESKTIHIVSDPKEYTKSRLIEQARKIEESNEIISKAPEVIRALTTWIYQTAVFPQPMLSLGASLSTIGFLMGRDFACAKSGIKANLYNICIAGSQEGKEHIKARCQQVMKEFGLMKNYQTAWTSGAAIELAMEQTDGQVYYITDEMGIMMNHLVGKYTNANQQDAVSMLLRLYTEMYYKGKGYAKSADRKPVEIPNPFVSICGFTQREPFFEAMSSMQAFTGVLNRMCLFKAPDARPGRNKDFNIDNVKTIPKPLKDALEEMGDSIQYLKQGKSHSSVTKYVPYTDGAKRLLSQIEDDIDARFSQSQNEGENVHLIIGRNAEVMEKIALIGSGGKVITEEILHWAKMVVDYSSGIMCDASKDIVDNDYERKKMKFVEFIEKRGGFASHTDINNGFKLFNNRGEKNGIIDDLKEADKIEAVPSPIGKGSGYAIKAPHL